MYVRTYVYIVVKYESNPVNTIMIQYHSVYVACTYQLMYILCTYVHIQVVSLAYRVENGFEQYGGVLLKK